MSYINKTKSFQDIFPQFVNVLNVPKTRGSFLNVKTNIMYTVNVMITHTFSIFTNNKVNLMFTHD